MPEVDVSPRDLKRVREILLEHVPDRRILAFGSRVTGRAKPFSDLDLAVMGDPVPTAVLADLREALDESDLPFKVDLVEWATTTEAFRQIIEKEAVPIDLR